MTSEEAINYLIEKREEYQKWLDITANPEDTYPDICNHVNAIDLSIAALRAQAEAENNEPLTVDELREMDGEPVRHGRWVHTDLAAHWRGKDECNQCGYHEKDRRDLSRYKYCPNCGAKMDLEEVAK